MTHDRKDFTMQPTRRFEIVEKTATLDKRRYYERADSPQDAMNRLLARDSNGSRPTIRPGIRDYTVYEDRGVFRIHPGAVASPIGWTPEPPQEPLEGTSRV